MEQNVRTTAARQGQSQSPVGELETGNAVKRSDSGQLSVSIGDVSKTETFKRDLDPLGRIRRLTKAVSVGR